MKISIVLFMICSLQVSANLYAQTKTFDLILSDVTVKEVLKHIEKQSDFRFFYNDELSDINRSVTIDIQDVKIEDLLTNLFKDSGISYKVLENNLIVITPTSLTKQQEQTVTGTISDTGTGEPLAGVTIQVKGTITGSISQSDGTYRVNIPEGADILVFSFIGYATQEVSIGGQTVIDVMMEEEITALEEVVVTGYSVERKKDIIGSVSVVNTEEMLQTKTASVGNQLQGRAAGVFVTSDGSPDGESKVRIRGFGSFGESEPLYIIDGVPADGSTFNSLNPNDVESIQILKDASSASVYGARAASGVVIISTKHGSTGKSQITLDIFTGINYVSSKDFPELLNAEEYGEYWWKSYEGAGLIPSHPQYGDGAEPVIPEYLKAGSYDGSTLEGLKITNPALFDELVNPDNYDFINHQIVKSADTDWFDEVFNPAPVTSIQLSATGGSEAGTYALSINYFDQDNTSNKWASFKRYTIRANSDFNIADIIQIGENLQVAYAQTKGSGTGSPNRLMNPLLPVWDIKGMPASGAVEGMGNAQNPIGNRWRNRFDKSNSVRVFGNIFAEVTLFKSLVARTSFGVSYGNTSSWDVTQQTYEHAENTTYSALSQTSRLSSSWTWTNTLTYTKLFGNHSLKLLLGSEAIKEYSETLTGARTGYDVNDDPNFVMLKTGIGAQSNDGELGKTALASIFGRLDYAYADKYLINATLRRDGSSKFGKNNRYGIFPAMGIGWRISQENFMQNLTWLDDLKLRASYGIIGNQTGLAAQNQYTQYEKNLEDGYAISGGDALKAGFITAYVGNPDARWEKSITTNVGFDMTLLSGRITMGFEYYIKETKDLLVENQPPHTGSNAEQPDINIGNMTNKGIDANITARGKIISDLSYEVSATFSHYRNTVDKVLDSEDSYLPGASDADMGVITLTEKGYPISYMWAYEVDGFFNTETEASDYAAEYTTWLEPKIGRWRIKDQNDDKIIDDLDRVQVGSPHPDFQVGLNISLAYKNFDLSTFIFWNQGGNIFSLYRRDMDMNRWTFNRSKRMLYESWTPENTDALLPKLDIDDSDTKSMPTDYYVENITYVRMKTLQLGYTVPTNLTNKLRIDRLRIYIQGQNLFTAVGGNKPFTGLDPGTALSGSDISMGTVSAQNPTPRQFILGLNLQF